MEPLELLTVHAGGCFLALISLVKLREIVLGVMKEAVKANYCQR